MPLAFLVPAALAALGVGGVYFTAEKLGELGRVAVIGAGAYYLFKKVL